MKYAYPAVFEQEERGLFAISFPDLESCYTSGQNLVDGCTMAEDVLCYCLYDLEREGKSAPTPSLPSSLEVSPNGFAAMISCDTDVYRAREKAKAVKKTLTVPQWLDEAAVSAGVNFSRVLQDGLKRELNLQ
jgi:predicted RNase H-like HicB family nuclease